MMNNPHYLTQFNNKTRFPTPVKVGEEYMKQYDKIWVPSESPHPAGSRGINGREHVQESNVIVLTLEELKSAMHYMYLSGRTDFKNENPEVCYSERIQNYLEVHDIKL